MKSLKTNIYFKVAAIVIIGLILLIPAAMIEDMIYERESIQKDAIYEVSSKWANEQTISGPFITIPFFKHINQLPNTDSLKNFSTYQQFIHVLPSELNISGTINPERRYRGIYEIVVYNSVLKISGKFQKPNFASAGIPQEDVMLNNAVFTVGIDDLRGIEKQIGLKWNMDEFNFNPGVESNDIVTTGINTKIVLDSATSEYNFAFNIILKGSQKLYFTPVGKVTDINIKSSWTNPSFNGAFLPDKRSISANGFNANWNVLHLNRNYPQSWIGNNHKINESSFGIDLILPVDNYQKSMRTAKYVILFIGFTFLTFFFIEVLNKIFIHPVQYILVGIALIVFFTLLLSISEQTNFNLAFIVSAIATILLITGYVRAILKSTQLSMLLSSILILLYTFIFVIIQLQDLALMIGSIGIFLILAIVMYFSRKIDWYNISMVEKKEELNQTKNER
ncbi:MAG: cell envelope integrity protein CreD [Candidatus Kapabacteria bacterium]|nr:cell envelope integrity protein CreD [Candidatus Kapabacteria bacterium]